jgi:hypothetical protein
MRIASRVGMRPSYLSLFMGTGVLYQAGGRLGNRNSTDG